MLQCKRPSHLAWDGQDSVEGPLRRDHPTPNRRLNRAQRLGAESAKRLDPRQRLAAPRGSGSSSSSSSVDAALGASHASVGGMAVATVCGGARGTRGRQRAHALGPPRREGGGRRQRQHAELDAAGAVVGHELKLQAHTESRIT